MYAHPSDQLPDNVKRAVRAAIFRVLRDHATSGRVGQSGYLLGPLHIGDIYVKVARILYEQHLGIVDEELYRNRVEFRHTNAYYPNFGVNNPTADFIREAFWDLFATGVLAPAFTSNEDHKNSHFLELDLFTITRYGFEVVIKSSEEIPVYDPEGYLAAFTNSGFPVDQDMMRYLEESISVFRHRHLLATVVLLGAASERMVHLWEEKMSEGVFSTSESRGWKEANRKKMISEVFDRIDRRVQADYTKQVKYAQLIGPENLDTVKAIFNVIKRPRNDILHHQGQKPTMNEVYGMLHMFVLYFRLISNFIQIIQKNPVEGSNLAETS